MIWNIKYILNKFQTSLLIDNNYICIVWYDFFMSNGFSNYLLKYLKILIVIFLKNQISNIMILNIKNMIYKRHIQNILNL